MNLTPTFGNKISEALLSFCQTSIWNMEVQWQRVSGGDQHGAPHPFVNSKIPESCRHLNGVTKCDKISLKVIRIFAPSIFQGAEQLDIPFTKQSHVSQTRLGKFSNSLKSAIKRFSSRKKEWKPSKNLWFLLLSRSGTKNHYI